MAVGSISEFVSAVAKHGVVLQDLGEIRDYGTKAELDQIGPGYGIGGDGAVNVAILRMVDGDNTPVQYFVVKERRHTFGKALVPLSIVAVSDDETNAIPVDDVEWMLNNFDEEFGMVTSELADMGASFA